MAAAAASLSTFSSLSLHRATRRSSLLSPLPTTTTSLSPSSFSPFSLSTTTTTTKINCIYEEDEIVPVSVFFDSDEPESKNTSYDPPDMDEEISTRYLEEVALNPLTATEAEIEVAYEKLYGPAYSGVTHLNNSVFDLDKTRQLAGAFGKVPRERFRDQFEEQVVQIRRVSKVVKGGKRLNFRAIVVVGDKNGKVGVGVGKAVDVLSAVQKAAYDGRRNIIQVPLTKHMTFPHRANAKYGAAEVMLRPAAPGTGIIAGGAVRTVLELAGLQNALGKQLRSNNALNNARATCLAMMSMKTFREVAEFRGIPMEELWK